VQSVSYFQPPAPNTKKYGACLRHAEKMALVFGEIKKQTGHCRDHF
jgi:hypothetical protein